MSTLIEKGFPFVLNLHVATVVCTRYIGVWTFITWLFNLIVHEIDMFSNVVCANMFDISNVIYHTK